MIAYIFQKIYLFNIFYKKYDQPLSELNLEDIFDPLSIQQQKANNKIYTTSEQNYKNEPFELESLQNTEQRYAMDTFEKTSNQKNIPEFQKFSKPVTEFQLSQLNQFFSSPKKSKRLSPHKSRLSPQNQINSSPQAVKEGFKISRNFKKSSDVVGIEMECQIQDKEVQPLNIYEDEFPLFFENYLSNLKDVQKNTFISDSIEILKIIQIQNECCFMKFVDDDEIEGMAILHMDLSYSQYKRIRIIHVSTIKENKFKIYLQKLIKFIFDYDQACEEIRIILQHMQGENEKIYIDKNYQSIVQQIGFKWKMMINSNSKRSTELGLTRGQYSKDDEMLIKNKIKKNLLQLEPISIKSSYFIHDKPVKIEVLNQNEIFDNSYNMLNSLDWHFSDTAFQSIQKSIIPLSQNFQYMMEAMTTIKEKEMELPVQKGTKVDSLNQVYQFLNNNQFTFLSNEIQKLKQVLKANVSISIQNLSLRWNHYTHCKVRGKDCIWIRNLSEDDGISTCLSDAIKEPIYIIPTQDSSYCVYIFSAEEITHQMKNVQQFQNFVRDVFKNCDKRTLIDYDLFIPKFKKQIIDDNMNNNCFQKVIKSSVFQTFEFSLRQPDRIKASLKQRHINLNKKKIIDFPFVIGIISIDIAEKLNFPINSTLVTKNDIL